METKAKQIGIWELEQSGNRWKLVGGKDSKTASTFLGLRHGLEVTIHPFGRDKLIIEEATKRS
jgi:hypothetical protein